MNDLQLCYCMMHLNMFILMEMSYCQIALQKEALFFLPVTIFIDQKVSETRKDTDSDLWLSKFVRN